MTYEKDRSLNFSLNVFGKQYQFAVSIKTEISNVASILVRSDSMFTLLVHSCGVLVVNTSKIIQFALSSEYEQESLFLPFCLFFCVML